MEKIQRSDLVLHKYNGVEIPQRPDGYINVTKMCQAGGKQWSNFWQLKSTKDYVAALEAALGIPRAELVISQTAYGSQGTWAHQRIASRLAQWISAEFAVIVDGWVIDITQGRNPVQSQPQATSVYIQRLENAATHEIADDLWSTFRESAEVLLLIEKEMGVPVDHMDLCDGSIGHHWSDYRKGQSWVKPVQTYTHVFQDRRHAQTANAYDLSELSHFRQWLRVKYVPFHLPCYLAERYGKLAARDIYERMGDVNAHVEEVTKIVRVTPKQQKLYANYLKARQSLVKPA